MKLPFGFRWSWQNLSRDDMRTSIDGTTPLRFPINGRCWLYAPWASRHIACFNWSFTFEFTTFSVGIDDESGFFATFAIIPMFLSLSIKPTGRGFRRSREFDLTFHDGCIRWKVWRDPMGDWDRSVPKWRDGSFDVVRFILGKQEYTTRELERRDVVVPMPEKPYQATALLFESTWKRPRWFPKRMLRVTVDVPEGIPCEGKGENSWDCGVDRTYGITTCARSIPRGVGELVGSVLHDRVRHGGWGDWKWPDDKIAIENRQREADRAASVKLGADATPSVLPG